MKQSPDLDAIQKAMMPGHISLTGFIGSDTRKLVEILIGDEAELGRLGITARTLTDRMKALRDLGARGLGEYITVEKNIEVKVDSVRGRLPCPFGDQAFIPKLNTSVRNLVLREEIVYSDLNIHMIESHGFFEGKGCVFRVEPSRLVRILFPSGE